MEVVLQSGVFGLVASPDHVASALASRTFRHLGPRMILAAGVFA
jgi:hypothetical protein